MKKLFLGFTVLSLLVFLSCEKEKLSKTTFTDELEDMVALEATIDDISEAADYEVDFFTGSDEILSATSSQLNMKSTSGPRFGNRYRLNQCPNVTIVSEEGGFPKTITLDYGEGTELANGRVLSGKIIITISASMKTDGATRTVGYESFFVDSVGISGGVSSVLSFEPSVERSFTITGEKVFTFPDESTITRTIDRKREWIWGLATPFDHSDDEIHITGTIHSVCSWGDEYLREITKALVKKGDCRFIVEGIVEISKNGELVATLDYGDGACDRLAKITKDGETKEITIGRRSRRR